MALLKRFLDRALSRSESKPESTAAPVLLAALEAYRATLIEMGKSSMDACPAVGEELKDGLDGLARNLASDVTSEIVAQTETEAREQLKNWGKRSVVHSLEKAKEIKEILLVTVGTAESVAEREQRCARQIAAATLRLQRMASLDDLTQIRASIEESAQEVKSAVDRMTAEEQVAIDKLKAKVSIYQAKLEAADKASARDSLTGLRNRQRMKTELNHQLELGEPFCVAIIDIDGFKQVNEDYGHATGDELLKQFAEELISASRTTDVIGRWGGDEFLVLLESDQSQASAQIDRLREWICGNYTLVEGAFGPRKMHIEASIGLAEHKRGESLKSLVERADADRRRNRSASRIRGLLDEQQDNFDGPAI